MNTKEYCIQSAVKCLSTKSINFKIMWILFVLIIKIKDKSKLESHKKINYIEYYW